MPALYFGLFFFCPTLFCSLPLAFLPRFFALCLPPSFIFHDFFCSASFLLVHSLRFSIFSASSSSAPPYFAFFLSSPVSALLQFFSVFICLFCTSFYSSSCFPLAFFQPLCSSPSLAPHAPLLFTFPFSPPPPSTSPFSSPPPSLHLPLLSTSPYSPPPPSLPLPFSFSPPPPSPHLPLLSTSPFSVSSSFFHLPLFFFPHTSIPRRPTPIPTEL